MDLAELFYSIHRRCYEQRANLTAAGQIALDSTVLTPQTLDIPRAKAEVDMVISYLLGKKVDVVSVPTALDIIKRVYKTQPFWNELLLDYYTWKIKKEKEEAVGQTVGLRQNLATALQQVESLLAQKQAIIESCQQQMSKKKFPVDVKKLITNYIHASQLDAKKAWEILTTNPAFFAPIQTLNAKGKTVLSPAAASEENKRLAAFLKTLKI